MANEQELDRQTSSSNIDERTFREVYNLPFEIALDRSTPESIMCSYNQINGVYACENPILNETLRATSATRATSCPTSARCTRPRRRSWPDSTRS